LNKMKQERHPSIKHRSSSLKKWVIWSTQIPRNCDIIK
jgi:hypothetical protein